MTTEGLIFHWDAYEIAPYSMGPIDVTVPTDTISTLVNRPYW